MIDIKSIFTLAAFLMEGKQKRTSCREQHVFALKMFMFTTGVWVLQNFQLSPGPQGCLHPVLQEHHRPAVGLGQGWTPRIPLSVTGDKAWALLGGSVVKESTCQCRSTEFTPWGRTMPWRGHEGTHSGLLAWEIPCTREKEPGGAVRGCKESRAQLKQLNGNETNAEPGLRVGTRLVSWQLQGTEDSAQHGRAHNTHPRSRCGDSLIVTKFYSAWRD